MLHDLCVYAVAMLARFVNDPLKHGDFVGFEFYALRERRELVGLHVIGDTFGVMQRSILDPDLSAFFAIARYAARLFCGTGTTKPST